MRYLIYILSFMVVLTAAGLVFVFNNRDLDPLQEYVLRVNDRYIPASVVDRFRKASLDHIGAEEECISSIITEEVLLQEALLQKLDQEESFRVAVKKYYEQSLVKTLLDSKMQSLNNNCTKEEVDAYMALLNKTVHISLLPAPEPGKDAVASTEKEDEIRTSFQNLALPSRMSLLFLKEGQTTSPVDFFNNRYMIRLNSISAGDGVKSDVTRAEVKELISDYRREEALRQWISGLVQKADVEIVNQKEEQVSK